MYHPQTTRWLSQDPLGVFRSDANLHRYAENRPTRLADPAGTDVWIEGASVAEWYVPLHISICVGNPTGSYQCYSYGGTGRLGCYPRPYVKGIVYEDEKPGGPIQEGQYYRTTPEVDRALINYFEDIVGTPGSYTCSDNCVTWSFDEFEEIIRLLEITDLGHQAPSPRPSTELPFPPTKVCCFPKGTAIWVPKGLQAIESIQQGDEVLTLGHSGRIEVTVVTDVDRHHGNYELIDVAADSDRVSVTPDHAFYNGNEWVRATDLQHTRWALNAANLVQRVICSHRRRCGDTIVYNLRTDTDTYLVGHSGMLVSGYVASTCDTENCDARSTRPYLACTL